MTWLRVLEQIAGNVLADLPPILAPIIIGAIHAVQTNQQHDPTLKHERALDSAMQRIGLAVTSLNDMHPGAIDPTTLSDELAKRVSDLVETTNAAHHASAVIFHDVVQHGAA